jgi:hypothetical protein
MALARAIFTCSNVLRVPLKWPLLKLCRFAALLLCRGSIATGFVCPSISVGECHALGRIKSMLSNCRGVDAGVAGDRHVVVALSRNFAAGPSCRQMIETTHRFHVSY